MTERPEPSYAGEAPFFFVSYAHADSDLAYPEMRWLQEAGFNLWYDDGIHVGSVWRKAIADALTSAAGMLFIASKSSVESDHCLKELSFALDEAKPVFVVQVDDTKLPGLLRLSLADRQMLKRADFDEPTYRGRLVQALSTISKPTPRDAVAAAPSQRIATVNPSIGLQALSTGDEETAFWAQGLLDDLGTLLGARWFDVTTTHAANKDVAARAHAPDLRYVVSGSVRRSGERYRLSLKLTLGGTGAQVWGARYEQDGDPIDAADAMSRDAAVEISTAIGREETSRVLNADIETLDARGLRDRAYALPMNTVANRDTIVGLMRKAVERDPQYAPAHSGLSYMLYFSVVTMFSRQPDEDCAEALRHVDRALQLAPRNPLVMQEAAWPHRVFGDEDMAMDLATRANAMGVDSASGRLATRPLFACLIQAGREEEAIALMLDARPLPERSLHTAYAVQGDWPEALKWSQRAAANAPHYLAWTEVANAMAMLDRIDEAKEIMRKVTSMVPTFKFSHYEKGVRITWRNRRRVVDAMLAGLRRLDLP